MSGRHGTRSAPRRNPRSRRAEPPGAHRRPVHRQAARRRASARWRRFVSSRRPGRVSRDRRAGRPSRCVCATLRPGRRRRSRDRRTEPGSRARPAARPTRPHRSLPRARRSSARRGVVSRRTEPLILDERCDRQRRGRTSRASARSVGAPHRRSASRRGWRAVKSASPAHGSGSPVSARRQGRGASDEGKVCRS